MFAIIMPACLLPAIFTLVILDRKARKAGLVNMASSNAARRAARELAEREGIEAPHGIITAPAAESATTWKQSLIDGFHEIDAIGLILLGFGWSLLLLPFSLKTYADGGWRNPSMIAMMVVGGILLIFYVIFEMNWAKIPSAPRRLVFNKTFVMAIVIDGFYLCKSSVFHRIADLSL